MSFSDYSTTEELEQALAEARRTNDLHDQDRILGMLAEKITLRDPHRAIDLHRQRIEVHRKRKDADSLALSYRDIAIVYNRILNMPQEALPVAQQGLRHALQDFYVKELNKEIDFAKRALGLA